jgi:multidrug efflux pump
VLTVAGFSFSGHGQSSGLIFVRLKDWAERPGANNRVQAVARRAMGQFLQYRDALAFAFAPPAAIELGNATGFDFELIDQANVGHAKLMEARNQLLKMASQNPNLAAVRSNGLNDEPQYKIEIDREKANALSLTVSDVNTTLSAAWGSEFIDQFTDRGRVKKVFIQGSDNSRMSRETSMTGMFEIASGKWYRSPRFRKAHGSMVRQNLSDTMAVRPLKFWVNLRLD